MPQITVGVVITANSLSRATRTVISIRCYEDMIIKSLPSATAKNVNAGASSTDLASHTAKDDAKEPSEQADERVGLSARDRLDALAALNGTSGTGGGGPTTRSGGSYSEGSESGGDKSKFKLHSGCGEEYLNDGC
jgi:hypothetical protein